MFDSVDTLLEREVVADLVEKDDIAAAVPYLDIVSIDYGSTNTMENTQFEIKFNIKDKLVDDDGNTIDDAVSVECIQVDMPFYLY